MISLDEDALICDLAETYKIYDYRQLPPTRVAVFAYGLKEESRIKKKMTGQHVEMKTMLLAGIFDRLRELVWFKTEDGQKGVNKPKLILSILMNERERESNVVAYQSGKEFEEARQRIIGGG